MTPSTRIAIFAIILFDFTVEARLSFAETKTRFLKHKKCTILVLVSYLWLGVTENFLYVTKDDWVYGCSDFFLVLILPILFALISD